MIPRTAERKLLRVGTVVNPVTVRIARVQLRRTGLIVRFPSRLNAMALDPSKIVLTKSMRYSPGEVIVKIQRYRRVRVTVTPRRGELTISRRSQRQPLIRHATLLMRAALHRADGLAIDVDNKSEIRHAGLGSSSGLIAAVACAVHELYGTPLPPDVLARYLAQNHGEEVDGDPEHLAPVQCIGGSIVGGLNAGGIQVLAGDSRLIAAYRVGPGYRVVTGIPSDYQPLDAATLLEREARSFPGFVACGKRYGALVAYRLVHEALPGFAGGDIKPLGDLVYDYRFRMGSIRNCSYCYPRLPVVGAAVAPLKKNGTADILALSSVGPAFFAVTRSPRRCEQVFRQAGLRTFVTGIDNDPYTVTA
ncbi:MAG: hypothetical protein V1916_02665 [Patescibacteria group bacterium]